MVGLHKRKSTVLLKRREWIVTNKGVTMAYLVDYGSHSREVSLRQFIKFWRTKKFHVVLVRK